MSKLLTVVTSTYNKGDRNRLSIQSILHQTFTDFDYIIINDGSPDNTKEILEEFDDPRLKVIHQENRGFVKTIISVMEQIKTPYVAIQGAGDISFNNRLETQLNFLETRPNLGVVSSKVCQVPASKLNLTKQTKVQEKYQSIDQIEFLEYNQVEQMIKANIINHGEAMFRMTAYRSVGGYRPFFYYAQDRDLWLRILENYSVARLNLELYLKVVDSEFDIFSNPGKVEKQILLSLFARRLAYNRLIYKKTVSDDDLSSYYEDFIQTITDDEKHQILKRLSSRVLNSYTISEDQINESIQIMKSYFPSHPLINSVERYKLFKTKIPYGKEIIHHKQELSRIYLQLKREVKNKIVKLGFAPQI